MRRPRAAAVLAGMVLAMLASPAAADDRRPAVRVGVFIVAEDGPVSPSRAATLLFTMERALEKDRRLEVIDKDRKLAENAGVVPAEVISEARGLLESGEALLRKKKPKLALVRLQAAVRQIEQSLAWVPKRNLARAQFLLGATHAVLGKKKQARALFLELLVWRPDFVVDTSIEPGVVLPLWEQARKKASGLPGGSIQIKSVPDRALAYVDGRFVGFTPTSAEGLAAGAHYVTLRKLGYQRAIVRASVSGEVEQKVRVDLVGTPAADEMNGLVLETAAGLGASKADRALTSLAAMLELGHLVFIRAPEPGADQPIYEGFLYSADRKLLGRASATTSDDRGVEEIFPELARALYAQVVFKKPKKKPVVARKPKPKGTPFYKKWWFWTGLGVVAAGAAVPFLLPEPTEGPMCPTGSVCGEVIIEF